MNHNRALALQNSPAVKLAFQTFSKTSEKNIFDKLSIDKIYLIKLTTFGGGGGAFFFCGGNSLVIFFGSSLIEFSLDVDSFDWILTGSCGPFFLSCCLSWKYQKVLISIVQHLKMLHFECNSLSKICFHFLPPGIIIHLCIKD